MRNLTKQIVLLAILMLGSIASYASETTPLKGVIRIKVQPQVALQLGNAPRIQANGVLETGITPLDVAAQRVGARSIKRAFPYAPEHEAEMAKFGLDRWYEVSFDESINPMEAAATFKRAAGVQTANCKMPMSLQEGNGNFIVAKSSEADRTAEMPFNDPRLAQQWHYNNNGSISGTKAGADINLFNAWKTTTGSSEVLVAIIDGGVDYKHEDLAANMFINEAEQNGAAGVDDDGNGYIDDVYGWNFCTNTSEVYPHPHGTHVAGTVAAVNNNGKGVCGVAGGDGTPGSGVKMISCQTFDGRSGSADGDFAAAIIYAANMGASIAQCSWGWNTPDYKEQDVLDAIDYFVASARSSKMTGGIMFFSTGNLGSTGNYYPGCYDKVVAVGSMTSDYTVASYSNYGEWVDIVAPGGDMTFGEQGGVLSTLPNNEYGYNEGTSMASPHVTGVAALVLAKHGKADMLNETLRQQILTSVNDIYAYNKGTEGLHGAGFIDAAKALEFGDGTSPEAVKEFSVLPAQDNITLQWVIPASSDNIVNHHIIYYSTEPFTAESDLMSLKNAVADTRFMSSGDTYTFELKGLASLTTYYIAIKAVNRWGDASELSPVVSATTNAGPKMTTSTTSISLGVTPDAPVASKVITIKNEDEGLLKWNGFARTTQSSISTYSKNPQPGIVKAYSGKLSAMPYEANEKFSTADFKTTDYPAEFKYFTSYYASIGDTDTNLTNSQAQWFYVDPAQYPEGFNLTGVKIETVYGSDPTLQIYKGNNIANATLIASWEPYFYSNGIMRLEEQHFFAPGESFWVVAHFPVQERLYPLGLATGTDAAYSNYCFMSNDMGQTWTRLKDALAGSPYESMEAPVWAITAVSQNPDWSQLLVMTPAEGTVKYNETADITIANDGQPLCNGTYKFNVRFNTNESEGNSIAIPVTLKVSGQKPQMANAKVVNFGDLLVGQEKTLTVEVVNEGYGPFGYYGSLSGNNIVCSSEHFQAPTYINGGFPARAAQTFEVSYTPKSAGSHTATITFINNDKSEFKITLRGVATEPAHISIEPETIEVGELNVDEATALTKEFKITNTGNYPLEFVFPKYSDETLEQQTKGAHKFGYSALSNLNGATDVEYSAPAALLGGTEISSVFSDDNHWSKQIPLGFNFPFYGKTYDKIYITSFGLVTFAKSVYSLRSPVTPSLEAAYGIGAISAYGFQLQFAPNSKVTYAKQDGKFVIEYKDVMGLVYDQEYTPISFRIILSPNGDIEMYYDNYPREMLFQEGSTLYCGILDPEAADELSLTSADVADYWGNSDDPAGDMFYSFATGTAVKYVAPKTSFITGITPAYGLVNPGEEATITASIATNDELIAGDTFNKVVVLSNDPDNSTAYITFNAKVTGESLQPVAVLENNAIEFGKVFRTSVAQMPLTVKNNGKDTLVVNSVAIAEGKFIVESKEAKIPAGLSLDYIITLPTENEGAVSDVVTVSTSAGELTATLNGEVIGVPTVDLSFTEITETVESGTELIKPLTISNNGNEPLVYAITPNSLVSFTEEINESSKTSYTYTSKVDNSNVTFEWIDIETTGLGEQNNFSYYYNNDFVAVELPFEFPYYGKKYSKMYIYNTGFVSFTERDDQKMWPEPPAEFPAGTVYTNIIAPYWGMHTMDNSKTAGTYHYVTENEAIVSFMEYGNTMNIGVCYQLILRKDGTFKFQYKSYGDYAIIYGAFGLAGISNEDGSQGFKIPERYIAFGNAVEFSPVVEQTVAPNASQTIDINVLTDKMAGEYNGALQISTNVPSKENIELPINLTITGTAEPSFPDTIYVENIMTMSDSKYHGPITAMGAFYEALFKVENKGTAPFTINNIEVLGGFEVYDSWYDEYYTMPAQLWYYGPELDWMTGEPTGNYAWGQYYGGPVTVGKDGIEFSVPIMMGTIENTPGTYDVPVKFYYGDENTVKEVLVRFVVTNAPYMVVDKEEIRVENVDDLYTGTETFIISNYGQHKLTYELNLDLSGIGESLPEDGGGNGGIAPAATELATVRIPMSTMELSDDLYNTPQEFEHRNALFHANKQDNKTAFTYGSGNKYSAYKAATHYVAPEEGFNISHVYFATTLTSQDYTTIENADFTIEIINGDNIETGTVLGKGNVHIDSMEGAEFVVAELERPVFIAPGKEFYVCITYPVGVDFPAYITYKEEAVVSNRYLGYVDGYGWFDVASLFKDQYGSLGYIMSCLETKEGTPWAILKNEVTAGEIAPGESVEVTVELNAETAPLEKENKAVVVIKSTDVYNPILNFPVYLSKNGTPVINTPAEDIYAKEAETASVFFTVSDPEGDNLTITLDDESGMVSIKSATADTEEATVTVNGNTITTEGTTAFVSVELEIAPGYETEGSYSFTITAEDNKNHSSYSVVDFFVEHTNRAPVAAEVEDIEVLAGGTSEVIALGTLFSDPDGDELTYEVSISDESIVTKFVSGDNVLFFGNSVGEATVTVTATDASGAQSSTSFIVNVVLGVGIGSVNANSLITVEENNTTLDVTCAFSAGNTVFAVYDYSGKLAFIVSESVSEGETKSLDINNLANGVYILKVATENNTFVHRFVKE